MSLKYSYTQSDGRLAIVHAVPKAHLERLFGPMTDAQYEAHVVERSIPADATDVTKLPEDWAPPDDRTFRDAWRKDGDKVTVDFEKAKKIAEAHGDITKAKTVDDLRALMPKRK